MASQIFELGLKLSNLIAVFGPASIKLVCYSALRDAGSDVFVHFAKTFLDWREAVPPPGNLDMNASFGPFKIELVRVLNMLEFQRTGQRSSALRGRFGAMEGSLDTTDIYKAMETSRTTMLFDDGFPMLRQMHLELHEKYRSNIVPPGPKTIFFQPARREIGFVGEDYLLRPGLVAAVTAIHARLTAV